MDNVLLRHPSVYLAAQFSRRTELADYAETFQASGVNVTSSWLKQQTPSDGKLTNHSDTQNAYYALTDLRDIVRADALVFFAEDPLVGIPRGARNVELGIAIALEKFIVVVGPYENVFHYLPEILHVDSAMEAVRVVKAFYAHS